MIADFATLCALAATKRPKAVCAWLARNRIHYMIDTKGHPVTTLAALDRALGGGRPDENEPNYDPRQWENLQRASPFQASSKKTADTTKSFKGSGTSCPGSTKAEPPSSEPSQTSKRRGRRE